MQRKSRISTQLILALLYLAGLQARESHLLSLTRKGFGLKDHTNITLAELVRNTSTVHHHHKDKTESQLGKFGLQSTPAEKRGSGKPEEEHTPSQEAERAETNHTEKAEGSHSSQKQDPEHESSKSQLDDSNQDADKEAAKLEAERLALANLEAGKQEADRLAAEGREAEKLQQQEAAAEEKADKSDEPEDQAAAESWPEELYENVKPPLRSKKLDIVIAHYYPQRIATMRQFWLWFFNLETVKAWKPYVFVYTQTSDELVIKELRPFIIYGGQIVRLDNAGRESHVYLQHISRHYNDLAKHTLFAQDEPNTDMLPKKFERMFVEQTGYLPLSFMGHVDCFEVWNDIIPAKVIPQLYGMLTHSLCPPTGYAAGFEGQFLVSRERILGQPLTVYRHLMDMVAAPTEHWVHEYHDVQHLKDKSNPYMGHALERAWSLAFNCFEVWRQMNCYDCEMNKGMEACGRDACQCYDID